MSQEIRLTTADKQRGRYEETNRNARDQIEVERIERAEKTARLRRLREGVATAASK